MVGLLDYFQPRRALGLLGLPIEQQVVGEGLLGTAVLPEVLGPGAAARQECRQACRRSFARRSLNLSRAIKLAFLCASWAGPRIRPHR